MGKASRKKKQDRPDVWALFQAGKCARCTKRNRVAGGVWCQTCHTTRFRYARSRRQRFRVAEVLAALDALEQQLLEQLADVEDEAA